MRFVNIPLDEEKMRRDIELLKNYPIDVLLVSIPDLIESSEMDMPFSESQLENKRLKKVSEVLSDKYNEETKERNIRSSLEVLRALELDDETIANALYSIGYAFGVLTKICIGTLISENPQFKDLYEKYINVNGEIRYEH